MRFSAAKLLLTTIMLCTTVQSALAAPRTAYVHLFEWKWTDIAKECENFLGPKGFAAVQISPPQEHAMLPGGPWYERYQPVSYKIESRSGTRAEFADMVRRCKAVGVDIYADAVINHMAWVNRTGQPWFGNAGSSYTEYNHHGLYQRTDFNSCDEPIRSEDYFKSRWRVQHCNIGSPGEECADLDTSSEYVRQRIADYLNDLLSLGVAGFRVDAAKHMAAEDIRAIFSKVRGNPYIFSEVIENDSEVIRAREYFETGDVTEFKFGHELSRVFRSGRLAWLSQFGEPWGFMSSSKGVTFIDNHDTQRGTYALTYKDGARYILANVFMLAWPYGYPQVLSSYPFYDTAQGPPSIRENVTLPVYEGDNPVRCFREWGCEHRIRAIANMVGFRNATNSNFYVSSWWTDGNNRIAFSRGSLGFVMINNDSKPYGARFQTGMKPGIYCDVVSGEPIGAGVGCTGRVVNVNNDGTADISVGAYDAVAIHTNAISFH